MNTHMTPSNRLLLFITVLAIALCAALPRWLDPEPAVYDAAFNGLSDVDFAVVSSPSTCDLRETRRDGVPPELLASFRTANAPGASPGHVADWNRRFALGNSTQVAALESMGIVPNAAGTAHVPLLRVSRVGFDASGSEALFCVRAPHGTALYQLRKSGGNWSVARIEAVASR